MALKNVSRKFSGGATAPVGLPLWAPMIVYSRFANREFFHRFNSDEVAMVNLKTKFDRGKIETILFFLRIISGALA